jgi:hypothetical protein
MAPRDRAPQLTGQPTVHRFKVHARDRGEAVVVARDLAWEEGLFAVGDARVSLVRSRAEAHEFIVVLPCLKQE